MKLRCIIVDDEPLARECLSSYIELVPQIHLLATFSNAIQASEYLSNKPLDILFLDINMPRVSGFDLVKSLSDPPLIIFITAHREFAVESYELNAFDYLLKPISQERFFKTSRKLKAYFETNSTKISNDVNEFFIKVDGKLIRVGIDQILFVEGCKDYVKIHLRNGKMHLALLSLKSIGQKLPNTFIRIHKSYIISVDHVDLIDGNQIKVGEYKLPIGRNIRDWVLSKIVADKVWKRE